jgi:WD40 repeat protein
LLQTVSAHRSLINAFAISPNGRWLVSVSSDKTIKLWELPGMIWRKDLGATKNSGAAVAFLSGENERFLVTDWSGWLYLYQGQEPDWRLQQQFHLSADVVYMVCPSHSGWWATLLSGDQAGLWTVPASGIEKAAQVSKIPAEYCSSSDDGRLTAIINGIGIEVRSNSTGERESAYYFANDAVTVAIQEQPPMVMTEVEGNLVAWPLSAKQ